MPIPTEKELFEANCHIGHRKEKWNPHIAPYLYGSQRGIYIFDLVKVILYELLLYISPHVCQ